MKALSQGGVFQFEGFRLDRQSRVLFRRDEAGALVPMAVGSRALDVLDVLLERAGNLVSRDEFMAAVWPATAVEDTNLNMQIAAFRPGPRPRANRAKLHPDHPRARLPVRRVGDAGRGRCRRTAAKRPAAAP